MHSKTLTLVEHLNPLSRNETDSYEYAESVLKRWNTAFSGQDRESFQRRLSWDGLTEESVIKYLSYHPDFSDKMPKWTRTLSFVIEQCPEVIRKINQVNYIRKWLDTIAFYELWLPFLQSAKNRVIEKAENVFNLLTDKAWYSLERQLLKELSAFGSMAAFRKFEAFRNTYLLDASPDSTLYHHFIIRLLEEKLNPLFEDYPVLSRQLCRLTDTWAESVSEFLSRLKQDMPDIAQIFHGGQCPGTVIDISPALSDRHHGGRRVIKLSFSSGLQIIYKPRNTDQEYAYNQLLARIASEGMEEAMPYLNILRRNGYGWVEYVTQESFQSSEEVERYFRQAGMMICMMYVLRGNDCHNENLIATQRGPILIDAECLLQPYSQVSILDKPPEMSVLTTGLLNSSVVSGSEGMTADASGLRGLGGHDIYQKKRVWKYPNTDAMTLEYEISKASPMQNLVFMNGMVQYPENYSQAIIDGFIRAYRFIFSHQSRLLSDYNITELFKDIPVRIIFRPSDHYAILIYNLATPKYQQDAMDKSLILESLASPFRGSPHKPDAWEIFLAERQALEDLDIPHFDFPVSNTLLTEQLQRMNESDMEYQTELIRNMLMIFHENCVAVERTTIPEISFQQEYVRQAECIAQQIQEYAISEDEGINWREPTHTRLETGKTRNISPFLYDGISGVMLFMSALAKITGNKKYKEAVFFAFQPVKSMIGRNANSESAIGICNGIGSMIYSLATISKILQDDAYVKWAEKAAGLITHEQIFADRRLDIEGGSAGCLIALLALYQSCKSPDILKLALCCGDHLIAQSHVQGDVRGWVNDDGVMLAGFAHGASGIGLALLRLYQMTGHTAYLAAGEQAFRYEQSIFSEHRQNWPVLVKRKDGRTESSTFMTTWCHGAPGIAIARLGASDMLKDERIRADLDYALQTTLNFSMMPMDYLCCGNLGRADILLTAGLKLDRSDLVKAAQERTDKVLDRAKHKGYFGTRLSESENRCFQPGFFKGFSGIGYTLLRMAYPEEFPSILFFD